MRIVIFDWTERYYGPEGSSNESPFTWELKDEKFSLEPDNVFKTIEDARKSAEAFLAAFHGKDYLGPLLKN